VIVKVMTITNQLGLHARASGALVRLASTFQSEITVAKDGTRVNAKSIMGLLLLAAANGSRIEIAAEGDDEQEAVMAIEALIRRKFHEE
jgi:phosphocarrier protein HPr